MPPEEGCFDPQNKLWWDRNLDKPISTHTEGADPYLLGEFHWEDGTPMTVLATDGGLLEKPVTREYITLAPAQRVDPAPCGARF